ncbi:helix-turn-helix domain-containing protein [Streptomyces sp. NPDC087440]|uniref:helix-turn-helix domain-containing protein n=1 Tax=Streptomyces sp. NPDC087440 TaxID=3365790 RepID=UPI003801F8FA
MRTVPPMRACPHRGVEGGAVPQRPRDLDWQASPQAWWGVELRNWRNQRGLSSAGLGRMVQLSGSSVERIEKAERGCTRTLADRFDQVLDAGGALSRLWQWVEKEAEKAHVDADRKPKGDAAESSSSRVPGMLVADRGASPNGSESSMERRSFITASGVVALAPHSLAELVPRLGKSPLPKSVRPEDVQKILHASSALTDMDNRYGGGGGVAREAALAQLSWAQDLLQINCPAQLKAPLATAIGRLAITMGAGAFDAYEHDDATQLLLFGARCAESTDNWSLRALALGWLARQAIWLGSPDVGLTYAENGLVRSDRLTGSERAALHNARARAYGKMRRRQETYAAVGTSDEAYAQGGGSATAEWMVFYDSAQHHGDTGHALAEIALLPGSSPVRAVQRLRTAVENHAPSYVRSRAFSGAKLATLIMKTGDPQEAVAIANRSLVGVQQLHSRRASADLRALMSAAAPHLRTPEVAQLNARIARTVRA